MTQEKDINYWKNNCEEDYITTPISVLRYISELEKLVAYPQQETFGSKASDATSSQTTSDKWKEYQEWLNEPIVDTNEIKKLIKQAHFDGQYLHSKTKKDEITFGDLRDVDVDSYMKGYNKAKEMHKVETERMYSEEEVLELLLKSKIETSNLYYEDMKEWFKQFKKD